MLVLQQRKQKTRSHLKAEEGTVANLFQWGPGGAALAPNERWTAK